MYAHGYKSDPAIEKINIDSKIKCKSCKIVKNTTAFSKKNLYHLKSEIYKARQSGQPFNTTVKEAIPCGQCTPQQQFEFECHGCGQFKGRDKFSKAQLRNPDKAYCWKCMEKRANTEPDMSDSPSGGDDDDSEYSGSDGDEEYTSLPSTMAGVSLGGTSTYASNTATPAPSVAGTASGFAKVKTVPKPVKYDVNKADREVKKMTNMPLATGMTAKDKDDVQVAGGDSDSEEEE